MWIGSGMMQCLYDGKREMNGGALHIFVQPKAPAVSLNYRFA
jgi:hypothetical protein